MFEAEMRSAIEARNAVFSGSKRIDSIQQWTYYADEHEGFAVEFEISHSTPFLVFEVSYCSTRPRIDVPRFFDDQTYQRDAGLTVMTTKQLDWGHEREVRGLKVEAGTLCVPELLRGVYLGLKCPEADEMSMREWIKESGRNIPLFRMKEHAENYSLIPENIA